MYCLCFQQMISIALHPPYLDVTIQLIGPCWIPTLLVTAINLVVRTSTTVWQLPRINKVRGMIGHLPIMVSFFIAHRHYARPCDDYTSSRQNTINWLLASEEYCSHFISSKFAHSFPPCLGSCHQPKPFQCSFYKCSHLHPSRLSHNCLILSTAPITSTNLPSVISFGTFDPSLLI